MMPPPPAATSSFGSLARSASLGRRKDPYAYSSDDVESGMGSMAFEPTWTVNHNHPPTQVSLPPPMPAQTTRDVVMSPARAATHSNPNPMNPPPVPAHPGSRPPQTRYDSGGSSPSRPPYASHAHRESFSNPYIPRGSDTGASPGLPAVTANPGGQWTDYRRPSTGRMPSTGSYSAHSPVSEHQLSSPYLRPDFGSSPHSPLANPYDLSPNPTPANLPPSPRHPAWPTLDTAVPPSPPYATRSMSHQAYPASQPVTPAKMYEPAPPTLPLHSKPTGRDRSSSRVGFRDVRDKSDLRPVLDGKNVGRRADPDHPGKYLSVSLASDLVAALTCSH